MSKNPIKNLNELVEKIDQMKKEDKLDLSSDQDLSIAIMNLLSIEEHLIFSGAKTNKTNYYDLVKDVREIRKELLKKIVKDYEGEVWCISKHLLAASMRLMEVGTKQLGIGKKEEAYDMFNKSYSLYSLFWALNMKIIDVGEVKKIDDMALDKNDKDKTGFLEKLKELVKKATDCCIE
ncbi:MAG TPA: hypothetical protein PL093_02010 [Candidatus Pacearchaeota archaeon]|jgi:hypothetical protein|nr:hypothetical protein [Candidatus Pacearchaeota archaeon]HRR94770.1 hypothetical protein [Candidatus Paceibacterota bacterium]HPC30595.1 hypothetical protein [Candidatus Pacearchaeota archaeon]HQG09159.1 hypothetical protein [Candidatus Pacearchaeota archaeon]HQH20332.1 hypothetical protein [Candidatus Pacearchaeota archaeon]